MGIPSTCIICGCASYCVELKIDAIWVVTCMTCHHDNSKSTCGASYDIVKYIEWYKVTYPRAVSIAVQTTADMYLCDQLRLHVPEHVIYLSCSICRGNTGRYFRSEIHGAILVCDVCYGGVGAHLTAYKDRAVLMMLVIHQHAEFDIAMYASAHIHTAIIAAAQSRIEHNVRLMPTFKFS